MKHTVKGRHATTNDDLVAWLSNIIEPGSTLLDIGCGPKLYSDSLKHLCETVITIDAWEWVEPDIVADLETQSLLDVVSHNVDYILMLDFVEHLDKSAAQRLIDECKQICNKKIILLTPLEQIWNDNRENVENKKLWCYGNRYDLHKSLWSAEDFQEWTAVRIDSNGLLDDYYIGYYEA